MNALGRDGRPPTSSDVARKAGVARSTVSHILNGDGGRFPDATRQRVIDAALELEYLPSMAARSLKSGRSDTVVVLLPDSTFANDLQDAVDSVVADSGLTWLNVVVRFSSSTEDATRSAIVALRPIAVVDFGILPDSDREWLEQRGITITRQVHVDDVFADGGISELQAQVLQKYAERDLWFATRAQSRPDAYAPLRFAAFETAVAAKGFPTAPRLISFEFTPEGSRSALTTMLHAGASISIASYNDDVAIALLAAARDLGISVPGVAAIVGADKTALGRFWSPAITTIDTDFEALVEALTRNLRTQLGLPASSGARTPHFRIVPGDTA